MQDPFLTETGQLAHVVLPASTYAEKDGTFTNLEGRVLRVRQALDPIGESLPDWHIMTALANGLGHHWHYESAQDIQNEIMKLLPGYYNLGQPRPSVFGPDAYLSNGYASHVAARYGDSRSATEKDATRPFTLVHGTGALSLREDVHARLRFRPYRAELGPSGDEPQDIAATRPERNSAITRQLRHRIRAIANQTRSQCLARDLFLSGAFLDPPVKDLMTVEADPVTGSTVFPVNTRED